MLTGVRETHFRDAQGNPAGGVSEGTGFTIAWQNGPLGRGSERKLPNGAFVEDILKAARGRLVFYQESKFACDENQVALDHVEIALAHLRDRTNRREQAGVEGTHETRPDGTESGVNSALPYPDTVPAEIHAQVRRTCDELVLRRSAGVWPVRRPGTGDAAD